MLLEFYVKGTHTLPKIIDFFRKLCQFTKFTWLILSKGILVDLLHIKVHKMVVQYYKALLYESFCPSRPSCWVYYTVLWLIRSKLYFETRIQEIVLYCLYRSRTSYIRLNNLTFKKTAKAKPSRSVIYVKASVICCGSFINVIVVAVFINCTNLWHH